MRKLSGRKAQSLTEIALILGVVGLALLGMEVYLRRGIQGKVRDMTRYFIGPEQREEIADPSESSSSTNMSADLEKTDAGLAGGGRVAVTNEESRIESSSTYNRTTGP